MSVISNYKKNYYSWAVVGMLWCLCFLNYADRQAITSIFPILEKEFGFSKFQLGMIGSVFMWLYAGGAFYAGFLSDKISRKPLILGGCFFWSVVTAATGWCFQFWQFVTIRALEGIGEAFYFPASSSLITDYHSKENRSKAIAFHQSGVFSGTIAGSCLGAWFAVHYGWHAGFYFFGSIGIILSIVLFFLLKEPQRPWQSTRDSSFLKNTESHGIFSFSRNSFDEAKISLGLLATLSHLLKQPLVLLFVVAFASANTVAAIFLTWMPTFLYEKFHMSLVMAGCSAVIFIQIASAISAPCSGWLADHLAQRIHNGRIILQIISLLLGAIAIIVIGKATTFLPLIAAMIAFGIFKAAYEVILYSSLFDHILPQVRGAAVGLNITCGYLGGALGPLLVGAVTTYGTTGSAISRMSSTISASAVAYVIAALCLVGIFFITRKNRV